jgi:hypothetical protein
LDQGSHLGSEEKGIAEIDEIEWFLAHAVSAQGQSAGPGIPKSERVHPAQIVHETLAVLFIQMENRFAIAAGGKDVAA